MKPIVRREIAAQTGIRGMAALVVFLGHANYTKAISSPPLLALADSLVGWHNEAVDLFFVLSGFIMAYVYEHRIRSVRDFQGFVAARIARIFPLHVLVLLFVLGSWALGVGGHALICQKATSLDLLKNFLLVQSWPFISAGTGINAPAWSVSVEWLLYLALFPALVLVRKWTRRPALLVAGVCVLIAMEFLAMWQWRLDVPGFFGAHQTCLRGITGFAAGFLLYLVFELNPKGSARWQAVWFIVFLVSLAGSSIYKPLITFSLFSFPGIVLELARCESPVTRFLSMKPIKVLGDASYSLYLWHLPLLQLMKPMCPEDTAIGAFAVWVVLSSAVVIIVSLLSYYLFERPVREHLRKLLSPSQGRRRPVPLLQKPVESGE